MPRPPGHPGSMALPRHGTDPTEQFGGFASELSYKVFLDRYTLKDETRSFAEGDLCLTVTEDDPRWPKKEVGRVAAVEGNRLTIQLLTGPDRGQIIQRTAAQCDRPVETSIQAVARRIGQGIAAVEPEGSTRALWAETFEREIAALRLVPGGRVWAGAGTGQQLTYFNCYVVPCPRDSRQGIVDTLQQMIEIMSRGGGVGINVSSLRPYRTSVRGVNGRSSGAVSWMDLYSRATGLVEQGGCFAASERIATDRGLIPARELADRLDAGEQIRALTHRGPRPFVAVFRNGVKPVMEVTTERGFTVRVTGEHRMGVEADGSLALAPMGSLGRGDELLLLAGGDDPRAGRADDVEAAWTLGYRCVAGRAPEVPPQALASGAAARLAFAQGCLAAGGGADLVAPAAVCRQLQEILLSVGIVSARGEAGSGLERLRVEPDAGGRLPLPDAAPLAGGRSPAVLATAAVPARLVKDRIVRVRALAEQDVYDFEVQDVHMLAGSGIYTSNSRRGALMLQLEDWHPDIWRFIEVKKTPGMVENANISVRVSDRFMAQVKSDGDWELVFPETGHPRYDEEWDGNLEAWQAKGYPVVVYETVKARKVWNEIIRGAWECAEPGVVFDERHEKDSNSWYFNPLICTNPCVAGEALVYTDRGLIRLDELYEEGLPVNVVVDSRLGVGPVAPATSVRRTGRRPVVRVQTLEGLSVRVTPDHRFLCADGRWVEAGRLAPGDEVRVLDHPGGFGLGGDEALGRALGQWAGSAPAPGSPEWDRPVSILGERVVRVHGTQLVDELGTLGLEHELPHVPESVFTGSRDMQVGFLRGFAECAAQVDTDEHGQGRILVEHPDGELLRDVQRLLLNLGVLGRIDGASLVIEDAHLRAFERAVGFVSVDKRLQLAHLCAAGPALAPEPFPAPAFVAHVSAVEPDGEAWVYDLTEPLSHAFVANGFVVHNCAEQPLPAWGVCTLGHVNLGQMVDATTRTVNWDALGRTVDAAVRFLDDVVDATPYFFEENRANQQRERRIGMGTLGLGELLIRMGLRYGSEESVRAIDEIYRFIAVRAYRMSVKIAQEKGAFPAFDAEKFLQSGFMQRMPEEVRQLVAQHGVRNVTLLTQAPTGTVGTMVGSSTGIEPFYALKYFRQSRLGFDEQYVAVAQEWLEAHPGEQLPDYFVGAMDLTPEEHIAVQAAVQRWTDSSISKTANAPQDYSVEDTARLYELAYDLGCKGVTIYRDHSRHEQVLHTAEASAPEAREDLRPMPDEVNGHTFRQKTAAGTARVVVNEVDGVPVEVLVLLGRAGSEVYAFTEAIGRLVSLALRLNGNLPERRRLELISEQLKGIGGDNAMGFGPTRVRSVADAIGQVLARYLEGNSPSAPARGDVLEAQTPFDLCPSCGSMSYVFEEGCGHCTSCGFSRC